MVVESTNKIRLLVIQMIVANFTKITGQRNIMNYEKPSLKSNALTDSFNSYRKNLRAVSEEHGERLHEHTSTVSKRTKSIWIVAADIFEPRRENLYTTSMI